MERNGKDHGSIEQNQSLNLANVLSTVIPCLVVILIIGFFYMMYHFRHQYALFHQTRIVAVLRKQESLQLKKRLKYVSKVLPKRTLKLSKGDEEEAFDFDSSAGDQDEMLTDSNKPRSTSISVQNLIGTDCVICFLPYKEGDVVSVSNNKNCSHVYHVDCILNWLSADHDTCPSCRENYLDDKETKGTGVRVDGNHRN